MKKILLALLVILLIGCERGGNSNEKATKPITDPCALSFPCLDTDWGDKYAIFYDDYGWPVLLTSDGNNTTIIGVWFYDGYDPGNVLFKGASHNCYEAELRYGEVDIDQDGRRDLILSGVTGELELCGDKLEAYDLSSTAPDIVFDDLNATFDSMGSLTKNNNLNTDAPISIENVEKIKIMIELIEGS